MYIPFLTFSSNIYVVYSTSYTVRHIQYVVYSTSYSVCQYLEAHIYIIYSVFMNILYIFVIIKVYEMFVCDF